MHFMINGELLLKHLCHHIYVHFKIYTNLVNIKNDTKKNRSIFVDPHLFGIAKVCLLYKKFVLFVLMRPCLHANCRVSYKMILFFFLTNHTFINYSHSRYFVNNNLLLFCLWQNNFIFLSTIITFL